MPMSAALISHLVGYNMTWSTTVKTVEKSNFFLQIPIIWKRFWPQLVFFWGCVIAVILTSSSLMPSQWRVNDIEVFVPMGLVAGSHILWPFVLNPWFLSFSVSLLWSSIERANSDLPSSDLVSILYSCICIYRSIDRPNETPRLPSVVPLELPQAIPPGIRSSYINPFCIFRDAAPSR